MRELFKFGDILSSDYHVYVLDVIDDPNTKREYESVSVPGKTGDLHFDNGRYENKNLTIKCACMVNAETEINRFVAALFSKIGYQRIEDSLHPDYYRLGEFTGDVTPSYRLFKSAARFDLVFNCKPQKWLKSGEETLTLSTTNKFLNPTFYSAYPIFEITGNGNLVIGSNTITIANNPGNMILDCELGDAYNKSSHANYNQYITVTGSDFPMLKPGENNITKPSNMTVKMTPRWWTL